MEWKLEMEDLVLQVACPTILLEASAALRKTKRKSR